MINIFSHRDYYDNGATTIVELYNNRVEICNPGGSVSAIKLADVGKRIIRDIHLSFEFLPVCNWLNK